MPVAAGMIDYALGTAMRAAFYVAAQISSATIDQTGHDFFVISHQGI
jgi:hypothetical protein